MSGVIKSGRDGNVARVDDEERLLTFAVTQNENVHSAQKGNAFFITHSIVNLTSDNESVIFYCKNDDTRPWILEDIKVAFGKSTGGDGGDFTSRTIVAPSGGTIFNGSDGAAINMKVGDPTILQATIKTGGEGVTATGGASLFPSLVVGDQMVTPFIGGPIILPPATSFAYAITPPTGNTSVNIKLNMLAYRDLED